MDPDLLLIFGFILTLLAIVLPFAYAINRKVARHEERKLELEARIAEAKAAEGTRENADYRKFEERLRVLERIATDGNSTLAAQIEHLRTLDAIDSVVGTQEVAR